MPESGKAKVLIVEDDFNEVTALTTFLQNGGFDVVSCARAADALATLETSLFQAAVVDLRLPDRNGVDLVQSIKERDPAIPVIVHTGFASYESARDSLNLGVYAYVEKQDDYSKLVSTVHQAVTSRLSEELQRSRSRYLHLWNSVADALLLCDANGRLVDVNQSVCDSLGYTRDELLCLSISDIEARPGVGRLLADENPPCLEKPIAVETRHRRKDGSELPVEVRVSVVESLGKTNILVSARDITVRQRTEQELQRTQELVIRQERLRALGEMASGIAHDLNNTLSPIIGYAEMLISDPQLPSYGRDWMHHIVTAGRDAAAVVQRLRQFYRPDDGLSAQNTVSLTELLKEIPGLTRPKWSDEAQRNGRTIRFTLELAEDVRVFGNPVELRELVTNLVFNAVDAMPSGGEIILSLEATDESATIAVTDTGVGMSQEVADRCFEPFFTTKAGTGTGLGLSVCHGIAKRHDGTIEIVTARGHGTTFRITLFRLSDDAPEDQQTPQTPIPARNVLYIDDDHRLCELAGRLLKRLGHSVDVAHGGAQGLELARQKSYDVVVTDLAMPDINGREVTRAVKSRRPNTPVIVVTGWASSAELTPRPFDVAPDCVVSKPLTADKMLAAFRMVFS